MSPAESQRAWLATRAFLNRHRALLSRIAAHHYPADRLVGTAPFLGRAGWLQPEPLELGAVEVRWAARASPVAARLSETRLRTLQAPGVPYGSYAEAMLDLDRPALLEDRAGYRLLELDRRDRRLRLGFGLCSYFDVINEGEAVAHELAAAVEDSGRPPASEPGALPLRSALGDPFALDRRRVMPGIVTLTIRAARSGASFLLHWRDPARVASIGGVYSVMPTGMFQPSNRAPGSLENDLDLWRSMVREFSEEVLDLPEPDQGRAHPIDYERWPFFRAMTAARARGDIRVHTFGLGVDPLSLATDILMVAVIEAETFDALFGRLRDNNAEGRILAAGWRPDTAGGVPFRGETVQRLTRARRMQPAGSAVLQLAWRWRRHLLGG